MASKVYECPDCGSYFFTRKGLRWHKSNDHDKRPVKREAMPRMPRPQSETPAPLTREQKAERIVKTGKLFQIHRNSWLVDSETDRGIDYHVDLEAGTCECQDYANGHTCKHLLAVGIVMEQNDFLPIPVPGAKPAPRKMTLADYGL